jgi:hypothetical protein
VDPQLGKAAFSLALMITVPALILLPLEEPGSAEFIVTAMALAVGVTFLAIVIFIVRRSLR